MSDITLAVLLVALGVAVSCVDGDSPSTRPVSATVPSDWGEPSGGLSCAILLPKASFRPGEPIVLSVAMRNTSDKAQTIWNRGTWPNHRVVLADSTDTEPQQTDHGRHTRAAFGQLDAARKTIPIQLQPQEVKVPTAEIELTSLFHLPAGRYTAAVEYADLDVHLRSNRLEFEIR